MNFAAGLPWITPGSAGFPIDTKISGISGPVEIPQEKPPVVLQKKTSEVLPGVAPINTTTVKGKVTDMWQALAAQFAMSALSSKSGSDTGSGVGDLIKTPWDMKAAPAFSQAQGGTSGDITGGVHYGDLIARGFKFDLSSVPSWFWLVAALSSGAGLLFMLKSGRKGKK